MRFALALVVCSVAWGQGAFESNARFATEEEAVAYVSEIDAGQAVLLGPDAAVVGEYSEFQVRFTVGRAGMASGGGLRIATAHDFGWDMWGGASLQTSEPRAPNFLTYRTSTGARLTWTSYPQREKSLFREFHPWQTLNEFRLDGPPLEEGDWIQITFGNRASGSPGVRIQPMDETAFEQKVFVDSFGDGAYLPLPESPSIQVLAGGAKDLVVVAKTDWTVDASGWANVWFDDGLGNPAADVRGELRMTIEPAVGGFSARHTLVESDRGRVRFEGLRVSRPGVYRLRARVGDMEGVSNPIVVHGSKPGEVILWGDLHTHTKYSDGRGTPREMFEFARDVAAIDFAGISDHAFTTTDWMWEKIQTTASEMNEPGRFVAFLGYEWSGRSDVGGDHNVYTIDDRMPLIRSYNGYNYRNLRMYHGPNKMAGHVEDLFRMLGENYRERDENLLVIPHYGGRPGNPEWHNPKLQRQVEIFSDHRRSENWASQFLDKGYRVGVMASTDNHSGNAGYGVRRAERNVGPDEKLFSRFSPIERGTSLVAVYAPELTRVSVFQGLYHRRTYATTGERIVLRLAVNGEPMGGETRAEGAVRIETSAVGTAGIAALRIVKNGRIIHTVDPDGDSVQLEYVDAAGARGGAFYYVDVVQDDGEKAISSPVWVN